MKKDLVKTFFICVSILISGGMIAYSISNLETKIVSGVVSGVDNSLKNNFDDIFEYGVEAYIINNPSEGMNLDYGKAARDNRMKQDRGIE